MTPFERKVLTVVSRIPPGRVATYGDVARLAGRPGAARAVGNILREAGRPGLPYHRVIAAGVTFAGKPPGGQTEWSGWWLRADSAEGPASGDNGAAPSTGSASPVAGPASAGLSISAQGGSVVIEEPRKTPSTAPASEERRANARG